VSVLASVATISTMYGCDRGSSNMSTLDSVSMRNHLVVQHDSRVIDSLAHLVNTDSLYRLRRRLLTPGDTNQLLHEIMCETMRLSSRYGSRPYELAFDRMEDTVWNDLNWRRRLEMEGYPGRFVVLSDSGCVVTGPVAPDSIDGVSLSTAPRLQR